MRPRPNSRRVVGAHTPQLRVGSWGPKRAVVFAQARTLGRPALTHSPSENNPSSRANSAKRGIPLRSPVTHQPGRYYCSPSNTLLSSLSPQRPRAPEQLFIRPAPQARQSRLHARPVSGVSLKGDDHEIPHNSVLDFRSARHRSLHATSSRKPTPRRCR